MISMMIVLAFAVALLCAILYGVENAVASVPLKRGLQFVAVFVFLLGLARYYGYV